MILKMDLSDADLYKAWAKCADQYRHKFRMNRNTMTKRVHLTGRGFWLPLAILLAAAGLFVSANRAGAACTYSISPTNRVHGHLANTGSVSVATSSNCSWTVVNTNQWITIVSAPSGSGTGRVTYAITANPSFKDRVGVVLIGGQTLTLIQRGFVCAYSISPTNRVHGFAAATNSVSVTTSNGCAWTVANNNSWITITSGTNGAGDGSLTYTILANPSRLERTGLVMIADKVLTLVQRGFSCTYSISPTNRVHGFGAATGTVSLTTSSNVCVCAVVNTNDWIKITSPTNGMGDGFVTYAVEANSSFSSRKGSVIIADQLLTLTQL